MRILMVAPTPFFADRGCHVRILGEAKALQALGHDVLICTYPLGRDVPDVRILRTWPVPWYRKLGAGPSWHKYYIDVMLASLVRRQIQAWQPDIVHGHLHEGACVAALAMAAAGGPTRGPEGRNRIPLVLDYQGGLVEETLAHGFTKSGSLQARWLRALEAWVERRADAILTSTRENAERLATEGALASGRVHLLEDAMDTEQFRPGLNGIALRRRCGIPDERPIVIYSGVLTAYQGIDVMLEAFAQARSRHAFHAVVVGYPDVDRYTAQARRLGLGDSVTFVGRVSFEELPAYLGESDLAVSAKLPGSEANGKLVGYMAAGLPSVAFDTPINRDLLADTGILVPDIDAAALARGLERLLGDPALRRELGVKARERAVARFGSRAHADRLTAIYRQLTGSRGAPDRPQQDDPIKMRPASRQVGG